MRRDGSLDTEAEGGGEGGVHLPLTPRAAVPQAAAEPQAGELPALAAGWGGGRGRGSSRGEARGQAGRGRALGSLKAREPSPERRFRGCRHRPG